MTFDFCFATYYSEKWLENCVKALSKMDYDKKKVGLYFADNASKDDTVQKLQCLKKEYGDLFGAFEILPQVDNKGFGFASNAAARAGKGKYVFFFNVDTEIFPNALEKLKQAIEASPSDFGAFELRQFPYEHPKYYNPITMETSWSSGACFVLRRNVFEQTGGFDESIFMYAEDVDLSWHLRALGHKIRYVPQACTWHYAYKEANEEKPTQVAGSLAGNLVLRYKYGTHSDIQEWQKWHLAVLERTEDPYTKHLIKELVEKAQAHKSEYRHFYKKTVKNSEFKPRFLELDYEFARAGAFYKNHLPKAKPEITVVVRTYRRPEVLALTLKSLTNQTYQNFKVIVIEDGLEPCSREVVEQMQGELNLCYIPLNEAAGRCRAGNVGLQRADTEYICFLDDDDYFFAEHLEVMVCLIEKNPESKMFAVGAVEGACREDAKDGTHFQFVRKKNIAKKQLHLIDFFYDNPVPIQAVVFCKELFERYGGLDESLDALEDWDLWMRYASKGGVAYAEKATSIYKVPAEEKDYLKRDKEINKYRKAVFEKMAGYTGQFSAQELYGIFWKPDESLLEDNLEQHKENLQRSAQEICQSHSWKVMAPLRMLFNFMRIILDYLQRGVNHFLGFLGKIFYKAFIGWNKLADRIGPRKPNLEKDSVEQLHSFVTLAQKSFSLRFPTYLRKFRNK